VSEAPPGSEWASFEINGETFPQPFGYLAKPGTYTVKLFKDGQQALWFQRFETDDSSICEAADNGNGTFTLTVKKAGECSIRIYYAFEKNAPSLTRTDLGVTAYTDKFNNTPGLSLWWHNGSIPNGYGFGATGYPLYVAEVMLDGVKQTAYTVADDDPSCEFTVQADGSLLIEKSYPGEVWFTVSCGGQTARFSTIFTAAPKPSPSPTPTVISTDGIAIALGSFVPKGTSFGIGSGSFTTTVYLNGTPTTDYTVTSSNPSVATAEKSADGTFELTNVSLGKAEFTISCGTITKTYKVECKD